MVRQLKRFDFLNEMIRKHDLTLGAEVGTGVGKNAMELLQMNPELHLIQVAYYPGPMRLPHDDLNYCTTRQARRLWWKRIKEYVYSGRVTVLENPSKIAARKVEDNSLDFVFIDADHSYRHCLQDIQLWVPKVCKGGLIAGHDYGNENFPGVKQAVEECFGVDFKTTYDKVWYTWKRKNT